MGYKEDEIERKIEVKNKGRLILVCSDWYRDFTSCYYYAVVYSVAFNIVFLSKIRVFFSSFKGCTIDNLPSYAITFLSFFSAVAYFPFETIWCWKIGIYYIKF